MAIVSLVVPLIPIPVPVPLVIVIITLVTFVPIPLVIINSCVTMTFAMAITSLLLSSINAEGGWWLHYQCRWQGHCCCCCGHLSIQRGGGGCIIDTSGRVVVIICRCRGRVVVARVVVVC